MHASLYINFPNVFAHAASSPQAKRSIHQGSLTVMSGCFMCARRKSSSISWMSGYLVCAEHLNRSGMAVRVATHLPVNRENNSPRIFCVDNLDWMSMPAWNRNVSFPYLITSVQAPSALIECESTYPHSKPVHGLRRADRQLRWIPAAILVDHALRTQRCEGDPARVCIEYKGSQATPKLLSRGTDRHHRVKWYARLESHVGDQNSACARAQTSVTAPTVIVTGLGGLLHRCLGTIGLSAYRRL